MTTLSKGDDPVVAECSDCGAVSEAPGLCSACRRGRAEYEAQLLLADVRALRDGAAPFDALTPEERAEQLLQILASASPRPCRLGALDDAALIELIGSAPESETALLAAATDELSRRLDALPDHWRENARPSAGRRL